MTAPKGPKGITGVEGKLRAEVKHYKTLYTDSIATMRNLGNMTNEILTDRITAGGGVSAFELKSIVASFNNAIATFEKRAPTTPPPKAPPA